MNCHTMRQAGQKHREMETSISDVMPVRDMYDVSSDEIARSFCDEEAAHRLASEDNGDHF